MLITAECKMYRDDMVNEAQLLAFANTRLDRPSGLVERLPDPATATAWLRAELGWSGPSSTADHQALVRLRDAVRGLLADRIAGRPPGRADRSVLNDAAQPHVSELSARWELIERPTEDQLCGRIARSAMSEIGRAHV